MTFKTFQFIKPPELEGSTDLVEAKTWLKHIQKALALMKVRQK